MYKSKVLYAVALAAFLGMTASAMATILEFPTGKGNPGLLKGTYGFNFDGGYTVQEDGHRHVGSGSFIFDGKGDLTGGQVYCNDDFFETTSNIVDGFYLLNTDGTGFMSVDLDSQFCDTEFPGFRPAH